MFDSTGHSSIAFSDDLHQLNEHSRMSRKPLEINSSCIPLASFHPIHNDFIEHFPWHREESNPSLVGTLTQVSFFFFLKVPSFQSNGISSSFQIFPKSVQSGHKVVSKSAFNASARMLFGPCCLACPLVSTQPFQISSS